MRLLTWACPALCATIGVLHLILYSDYTNAALVHVLLLSFIVWHAGAIYEGIKTGRIRFCTEAGFWANRFPAEGGQAGFWWTVAFYLSLSLFALWGYSYFLLDGPHR
jgi:hypothetical protein